MSKSKGVLLLTAARIAALVLQIASIPLVQSWVGLAPYGVYLLCNTYVTYLTLIDLGFSEGAMIHLGRKGGSLDDSTYYRQYRAHMAMAAIHGVVGAAILLAISRYLVLPGTSGYSTVVVWTGAYFALTYLQSAHSISLVAKKQFGLLAIQNAVGSIGTAFASLALAYSLRSPHALFMGGTLAVALNLVLSFALLQRTSNGAILVGPIDWSIGKDYFRLGVRSYANRFLALVAGNSDRLLLGSTIGPVQLTHYSNSARIPDGLIDLCGTVQSTIRADISRAQDSGPEQFARTVDRYSLMALAIGMCFVLMPCSVATGIFVLWLGNNAYAGAGMVALALGFYRGISVYYNSIGLTMTAVAKQHVLFPFVLWNALMTATLTITFARAFGIEGVAFMNVLIHGLQTVPLLYVLRKTTVHKLNLWSHLRLVSAIIVVSVALAVLFYILTAVVWRSSPWISVALLPVSVATCCLALFESGLAPKPDIYNKVRSRISPRSAIG